MVDTVVDRTSDDVFEKVFGSEEDKEALLGFLSAVLKPVSGKEPVSVEFREMSPVPDHLLISGCCLFMLVSFASGDEKYVILQTTAERDINERALFYTSNAYKNQMTGDMTYSDLKKTVYININTNDEPLFPYKKYHSTFSLSSNDNKEIFFDDIELHFLELCKVTKLEGGPQSQLDEWAMYFNNVSAEEMAEIAARNKAIKVALNTEKSL